MGSQRLSARHLPSSWQGAYALSEAAPKLRWPQQVCTPWLGSCPVGPRPTDHTFLARSYISSATAHRCEPLPDGRDRTPTPRNLPYQNTASSPLPATPLPGLAQLPGTKARLN